MTGGSLIRKLNLSTRVSSSYSFNSGTTGISGTPSRINRSFVPYCDTSSTNYGINLNSFANNMFLYNTDSNANANPITCVLTFPTDVNGWVASSIFIKNTRLYVVATRKITGQLYPSYIGT